MLSHKFKIGENVFLNRSRGPYVVIKRLPERNGELEYQIRDNIESNERVVREGELKVMTRQAYARRV